MSATLAALLDAAATELAAASPAPRLDAELLLAHALGKRRSYLRAYPEKHLDAPALQAFRRLLAARKGGEPIAYLTSKREFWSLPLKVTPATLIPRHETELLVELALQRIPQSAAWRLLDLGTGSGAVALALACERPHCRITATDLSMAALAVAADNTADLGFGNVELLTGDWFAPLGERRFHLIVSNPPYVREDDPHLRMGDVRFEPRSALTAGSDGLRDLSRIIASAPSYLEQGAWILLEHGHDQGAAVRALLSEHGFRDVATSRDMQGVERVSGGLWANLAASR
ncbi:MAG TPA: peptide chain release factor N(5)-glutamine methyltransferase [Gammaproteobacteria bacterium]|nr:peptide chain release factor N(5)-glutamine methyltransferase [Gammaproteobacteria bacterium]